MTRRWTDLIPGETIHSQHRNEMPRRPGRAARGFALVITLVLMVLLTLLVVGLLSLSAISLRGSSQTEATGNEDYPVKLACRVPGSERLYPLCQTKWRHDPRSRGVAFIITEPGHRSPRVMVFSDCRAAPPEQP